MRGRVIRVSGQNILVEVDGLQHKCRMRGRLKAGARTTNSPVITGDWVEVVNDVASGSMIESVFPRKSHFTRSASGSRNYEQIIAVNIDQLAVVTSARQPALRLGFIDRAIITALRGQIEPIIVVNKTDLDSDASIGHLVECYQSLNYSVFFTSATSGQGIDEFGRCLENKVTAFVGQSGVGKSSLLNCIEPGLGLKTREIMTRHDRGRHTTTAVQLFPLGRGGYVADTPGIKELQLCGVNRSDLVDYFAEMAPLAEGCYFRDCAHINEPDCAVLEALEQGSIPPTRYASYLHIMEGLDEA
jgi:ribosome biogenesis GTPase